MASYELGSSGKGYKGHPWASRQRKGLNTGPADMGKAPKSRAGLGRLPSTQEQGCTGPPGGGGEGDGLGTLQALPNQVLG